MNEWLRAEGSGGLQRILLALCVMLWSALVVELWATEHYGVLLQQAPLFFCVLNLVLLLAHWRRPHPTVRQLLAASLLLSAIVGIIGLYIHLSTNIGLKREAFPEESFGFVLYEAIRGRLPLLAPGSLTFGAALTWLAARGVGTNDR